MFFGLTLFAFGLAWFLRSTGVIDSQSFGVIGSVFVTFAGLLKILNLKKSRKHEDSF